MYTNRPEQPQNVRATAINSRNLTLEWVEPHDNNAPIQGYRVTYRHPAFLGGGEVVLLVGMQMAEITGLHPGVTYSFTVVASNEIGNSDPSAIAMITTLEEGNSSSTYADSTRCIVVTTLLSQSTALDNFPQNVTAMAMSSTDIAVNWEVLPEVNRRGVITHYQVQYDPLMNFGGLITLQNVSTINESQLSVVLSELQEYLCQGIHRCWAWT